MITVYVYMRGGEKFALNGADRAWAERLVRDVQQAFMGPHAPGSTLIEGRLMFNISAIDVIQIGEGDGKQG